MSDLIVKDNALIEASYVLGLAEQRLILLAIVNARETGQGITHDSLLHIHAHDYAEYFGIDKNNSYDIVKEASKGLFDRYVTYHDKNPKTGNDRSFHCRWVDKIGYEKSTGTVYLRFTSDIVPLITRLEERFTSYELEQVASITSSYAIRLYELLIQWRTTSKTPVFEVEEFRKRLGVEPSKYNTMSNFKKHVLDFAVNQINAHTDITVKYENQKQGRTITGFIFKFTVKKTAKEPKKKAIVKIDRDQDSPDLFNDLTDKEQAVIKQKIAEYIAQRKITDDSYKVNVQKKAIRERWGIAEYNKQQDEEKQRLIKEREQREKDEEQRENSQVSQEEKQQHIQTMIKVLGKE